MKIKKMKLDNLSKHGILTGSVIIIFLSVIIILAAIKIYDINNLAERFRDFNEFEEHPPPSLDVPIGAITISIIAIALTCLMIFGIVKERLLFLAPWLILFSLVAIGEITFFVHQLVHYFSAELLLYIFCILGIQLLIFSPIAFIFYGIRCKNKAQHIAETATNSNFTKNGDTLL